MNQKRLWALCLLMMVMLMGAARARADAALLLEEPYGGFGEVNPTGHAAIYLSRVCAATPLVLRKCNPGEPGVVISRYYNMSRYDWVAIPMVPYLYAVTDPSQVPEFADSQSVAEMRDQYRRRYLETLAPDRRNGKAPRGEWPLLVGEAYDRKIYGFQIETTEQQDEQLIQMLNSRVNKRPRRNFATFMVSRNCADFAREILNFYYPHSVHRNLLADAGITTPKQVAKSLVKYAQRNSDLEFTSFVIPQIPGSRHRSAPVDGVAEALVRSKKYVVPLAVLHPFIAGSVAALYIGEGRFSPGKQAKQFPTSPEIAALMEAQQKPAEAAKRTIDREPAADGTNLVSPLQ